MRILGVVPPASDWSDAAASDGGITCMECGDALSKATMNIIRFTAAPTRYTYGFFFVTSG